MNTSQKRVLNIFTDNIQFVKENYSDIINNIMFTDKVEILSIELLPNIDKDDKNLNTIIINDMDSMSHLNLIYIVKLVGNEDDSIDLIFTDSYNRFMDCYKLIFDGKLTGKHPTCIDDFFEIVSGRFTKPVINIGFVSDNRKYMDGLISDLYSKIYKQIKLDDYTDYQEAEISLGLNAFMPKLVQGWINNVWYPRNPKKKDIFSNKYDESSMKAKIYLLVSIDIGTSIINYHFIEPYRNTDFSECFNHFDTIFIDMYTHYSKLTFGEFDSDKFTKIVPFTSVPYHELSDISKRLNILDNMMKFAYSTIEYDDNETIHKNDISRSVKVYNTNINFNGLSKIASISPFEEE